jgi:serine/threonine protein kinase
MLGSTLVHYTILEKLGEGGMGVVYKARDTRLDRLVALKVLTFEAVADPARKARLVQEARAASALNHPNIVHIYEIDSDGGRDFIAMEYVPGATLDRHIGRKGLVLRDALKYAVQISDALTAAHAAGIVHRDLKPGNIMITGPDTSRPRPSQDPGLRPGQAARPAGRQRRRHRDPRAPHRRRLHRGNRVLHVARAGRG